MLYTGRTPNGFKVTVFLEELKAAYGGPDYEYVPYPYHARSPLKLRAVAFSYMGIDIWTNVQKEPWFVLFSFASV